MDCYFWCGLQGGICHAAIVDCKWLFRQTKWLEYDTVAAFGAVLNSPIRKKVRLKEVYGEFKFLLDHCETPHKGIPNLLSFKLCRVASCVCMENMPTSRLSTMLVARMQQMQQMGDMLPCSIPNPQNLGDHATWQQMAYDAMPHAGEG